MAPEPILPPIVTRVAPDGVDKVGLVWVLSYSMTKPGLCIL
jgi:hypothetical protein